MTNQINIPTAALETMFYAEKGKSIDFSFADGLYQSLIAWKNEQKWYYYQSEGNRYFFDVYTIDNQEVLEIEKLNFEPFGYVPVDSDEAYEDNKAVLRLCKENREYHFPCRQDAIAQLQRFETLFCDLFGQLESQNATMYMHNGRIYIVNIEFAVGLNFTEQECSLIIVNELPNASVNLFDLRFFDVELIKNFIISHLDQYSIVIASILKQVKGTQAQFIDNEPFGVLSDNLQNIEIALPF